MCGSRGKLGRPAQGNCAERTESRRAGLAGPSRRAQKKMRIPLSGFSALIVSANGAHCLGTWCSGTMDPIVRPTWVLDNGTRLIRTAGFGAFHSARECAGKKDTGNKNKYTEKCPGTVA